MVRDGNQCNSSSAIRDVAGQPAGHRRAMLLAGVALFGAISIPALQTASASDAGGRPTIASADKDIIQDFIDLLHRLFGMLGGGADSIPRDPNEAIYALVGFYELNGLPPDLGPVEIDAISAQASEARDLLKLVEWQLDPVAVAAFKSFLDKLAADLAAYPNRS